MASPRALAVWRLMTSSNLVACSTGRSAGLAPLRILSMRYPARRYISTRLGPQDMRPPLSTNSRTPYIAGSRALAERQQPWLVCHEHRVSKDHEPIHLCLDHGP